MTICVSIIHNDGSNNTFEVAAINSLGGIVSRTIFKSGDKHDFYIWNDQFLIITERQQGENNG